jgi:hypothetical protein
MFYLDLEFYSIIPFVKRLRSSQMAIKSTTDERNPMRLRSVTRDFITATPSITASTNTAMSQTPKNNVNSSASTQLSSKKSKILEGVLKTMTEDELRNYLSDLSKTMPSVKGKLEQDFITQGKRIVRYRDGDEDDFDLDSYYEDMESDPEGGVRVRPITIGDEEYTARISACVNCGQCFDLTQNRSKVCHWHSGTFESSHLLIKFN